MDPTDDEKKRREVDERVRADLISLRAALLAMHAKFEYAALMLRLEAAHRANRARRQVP